MVLKVAIIFILSFFLLTKSDDCTLDEQVYVGTQEVKKCLESFKV